MVTLENQLVALKIDLSTEDIQWNFLAKFANTTVVQWSPLPQLTGTTNFSDFASIRGDNQLVFGKFHLFL